MPGVLDDGTASRYTNEHLEDVMKKDIDHSDLEKRIEELTSQVEKLNQMKMRLTGFDEQHFEPFTLELLDPRGHSQILHPDASERELTEEEIKELPIGPDPAVLEQ